jgi:hypothetical protein
MPDVFISNPPQQNPEEHTHVHAKSGMPVDASEIPHTEAERRKYSGHSHSKLSAFNLYPEHIDFETRSKDEKIILLLRAHPITNLKWIFVTLVMLLVPGVIQVIGFFDALPAGFDLVVTLSFYLLTMAYALEHFLSWYFNVYLVTTLRVVDVDFYNLIYKQVSDADLDKIQDVTYNMGGVVRTVFNYGDVLVQTAAEVTQFEFLAVPSPDKVVKIMQDLTNKLNDND